MAANDRTLFQDLARSFKGPQGWIMVLVWFFGLAFFVLAVLCACRFFEVETTKHQIMYAALFLFCMQAVALLKMAAYNRMDRNAILDAIAEAHGDTSTSAVGREVG
jgi:hypothetical protein